MFNILFLNTCHDACVKLYVQMTVSQMMSCGGEFGLVAPVESLVVAAAIIIIKIQLQTQAHLGFKVSVFWLLICHSKRAINLVSVMKLLLLQQHHSF